MRAFVDIGAFHGEATWAALDPIYGFDVLYCLEPVEQCAEVIRRTISDPRVRVAPYGLLDRDAVLPLYGAGTVAGSVFADHVDADLRLVQEARFRRASEFFDENFAVSDVLFVKMNCEGSEGRIITDLLASGWFARIASAMVDFDVRKVASERWREEAIRREFEKMQVSNYCFPEEVMYGQGSCYGGIRHWLDSKGARCSGLRRRVSSALFHAKNIAAGRFLPYYKLQILRRLPRAFVAFYYRSLKPRISAGRGSTAGRERSSWR